MGPRVYLSPGEGQGAGRGRVLTCHPAQEVTVRGRYKETALWTVWLAWGLLIVARFFPGAGPVRWAGGLALVAALAVLLLPAIWAEIKESMPVRLLKRNLTAVAEEDTPIPVPAGDMPETPASKNTVKTRKDTCISPQASVSGELEGEGNIVIEGMLEGSIRTTHEVRIEAGGTVLGDIDAQHIMINGHAEGRLRAAAVTVQQAGCVQGDIITDALVIEKGGRFTGQSQLKTPVSGRGDQGDVTPLPVKTTGSSSA